MSEERYTFKEIKARLFKEEFPFEGITELGSARFSFLKPSFYAGIAVHSGDKVREEILKKMFVSKEERYKEEDPYTELFAEKFPISVIAMDSRFEYDVNRDKEKAIYHALDMAWGLRVFEEKLTEEEINRTLDKFHEFHKLMDILVEYLLKKNKYGVIFDCHSYNGREKDLPWDDRNRPAINIGTAHINKEVFGSVIEDFLNNLSKISIAGKSIWALENVVFKGGPLSRRLTKENYNKLMVLAVEFRKIFMDEWSGELYKDILEELIQKFYKEVELIVQHKDLTE